MNRRMPYQQAYSNYTQSPYNNYPSFHPAHQPVTHVTPYELFAKPEQPLNWLGSPPPMESSPHNQTNSPQGALGAFTDGNGQVDFDKMLSSIGQVASTYHQVSPIVKQLSSLVKMFR